MVAFAGYEMPVRYDSIIAEHHCVRENVGVFDISHMGEFLVEGGRALDLLRSILTNDPEGLKVGKAMYSCMTNEQGGIVDDLVVYQIDTEKYMLVVNAANIDKGVNWISQKNTMGANLKNVSDDMGLLAIQGPNATQLLENLTDVPLADIPFYHFTIGSICSIADVIISATGYTGSGGFELYCKSEDLNTLWNNIFEEGKSLKVKPIGLAARDTLRLEKGYCLYGNDIDDTTSPIEAGLGWVTKFNHPFTASSILKIQKDKGSRSKLVGFEMLEKSIPRKGYPILDENGYEVGHVTSGNLSPSTGKHIGMGYVQTALSKPETKIYIGIRKEKIVAKVVKLPFL
ncbi:aminomethyltransferase [Elysia marginata]|uniref:Aminomethyltransferase n=1 Tax=Elysia marginata TaxID=1093978 RepID=A0AAV4G641_9GAST|nr:aminomethyltransferase [Elysia marginata]